MIIYLVKSGLCLAIFWSVYQLFLAREKTFRFNRFYLLGSLIAGMLIPFLVVSTKIVEPISVNPSIESVLSNYEPSQSDMLLVNSNQFEMDWFAVIWGIGCLMMLIRFSRNLNQFFLLIKTGQKIIFSQAKIILHPQIKTPFTFLNFVFLNQENYQKGEIDLLIINHELTHIQQKHSLDILFIELLHSILWFNPILILYKKSIKLNHEFLADKAVLRKEKSPKQYIFLLLNQSHNSFQTSLENSFTYGEIKQRLNMMLKPTNKPIMIMKQVLIVPIFLALIVSFGQSKTIFREINQSENNQMRETIPLQTDIPKDILIDLYMPDGGMMAYRKRITQNGKEERWFVAGVSGRQKVRFFNSEGKEITKLAKDLTEKERGQFWDLGTSKARYQKLVPPIGVITEASLEAYLNSREYGVWLDGKRIQNDELKNYEAKDFHHALKSRLARNAKNYGIHTYQVNIYTMDYFMKEYGVDEDKWWIKVNLNLK